LLTRAETTMKVVRMKARDIGVPQRRKRNLLRARAARRVC
jgi:hypothetical protein